ncbi:MAG: helix-turn-helix domain-containing protein [Bacteroidia bacterium]|nr:helix-turn-helix domain-containing protein [Bacteroidia bacterium]
MLIIYLSAPAQVKVIITRIPPNTPHDATLYLVGDFNNWNPGDPNYVLKPGPDSTFSFTFIQAPDSFDYKITRGNWSSVEGRANGRAITNRVFVKSGTGPEEVKIQIKSWEDIEGNSLSLYSFLLLFSSFQGILLIIAINGIQERNASANRVLSLLIVLISFALLGRVSTYDREIFNWQPKLILLPEMILFVYAPVFYIYIRRLLKFEPEKRKTTLIHFLPAIIHFVAYLPLFFREKKLFIQNVVDQKLYIIFALVGGLALVFNIYYWFKVRHILNSHEEDTSKTQSFEQNLQYLHAVMGLNAICMIIWLFIYLISGLGYAFNLDITLLRERSTDTLWVVFSFTTYFLGYFAMNQPEIFKLPRIVEKYKDSSLSDKEMEVYKKRLTRVMDEQKVYLNPELTLADLSDYVETSTHTLSRVINEGYGKSFYDFINHYRVEAFTQMANDEKYQNETFLSLALSVGFNSKTTFNRAFKKVTGTTPRAYLKEYSPEKIFE